MRKYLVLCLIAATLAACSSLPIHKLEIEQGNIMDSSQVNRIHRGMSESQVKAILGEPVMDKVLDNGDPCYVYTFQIGNRTRVEKRLTLIFHNGTLAAMQREGI